MSSVRQSQYSQISIKALNADSSSVAVSSSYAVTASHALNSGGSPVTIKDEGVTLTTEVASINFTGDGVTVTNTGNNVTVNIPGGGGSFNTSSLVTTSSFNTYTASINTFTSSYSTGSFTGSFTGSLRGTSSISISSSFSTTASYINPTFISASAAASGFSVNTGSFLITASVISNTITFTKGDGNTFPIIVDTGSSGGNSITVQDQGTSLGTTVVFNFTGSGVTSSLSSNTASIQINSTFDLMSLYNLSPTALLSAANLLAPFPGLVTVGNENTVRACYVDRLVNIKGMAVRTASAQNAGGSLVITLRKGSNPAAMADTSVVITIAAGSGAGAYTGDFNEIIGNGYITYKVNNNANATGATIGSIHLWGI
jgi:hypothetical protein